MKRRLTAVLLILAMLMGLFPMQALAEDNTPTSAQSIFLSQSQVQLQVGEQIRLTAEVIPESAAATAVWVSQDESIATVENGVITAVASGNTTVSLEVGSLKALCSVAVVPLKQRSTIEDVKKVRWRISIIRETVTLDDEPSIVEARMAYDALSPEMQQKVGQTYLDKLLAAEYRLRVRKLPSVAVIYDKTGKYLADIWELYMRNLINGVG